MAANTQPIFPVAPIVGIATLTAAAAITVRTNIVGTAGLVALTLASAAGLRVDAIVIKAKGSTPACAVGIWISDGATSYLFDEIDLTAVTASTTVDAFAVARTYTNLVLPPTYRLYVSETVQADINVFAMGGTY